MTTVYTIVQNGVVVTSFGSVQKSEDFPGYTEMDDTDPRWSTWLMTNRHPGINLTSLINMSVAVVDPASYAILQKDIIAEKRFNAEIAGIIVSGIGVSTTRESRALISAAYISAENGSITSFDFKSLNGYVELTAAQMKNIIQAVNIYVQVCFSTEKTVCSAIDAALASSSDPATQVAAINMAAIWPPINRNF